MKHTAYVTGADRGLGLSLVKVLLEKNYKVYAGSYLTEWKELQDLRNMYPEDLVILSLDVTDDESVAAAAKKIASDTDSLNLLINNAGIAKDRSGNILEPQYFDDALAIYNTNSLGPLRVTHSVIRLLLRADPKTLVNISSVAGSVKLVTRIRQYGYTMSKSALNMQSKIIHNHFKDQGLKVMAVHPGWMKTHIFGDIALMKDAPFEPIQAAKSIIRLVETVTITDDDIFMDHEGNKLPW